MFILDFFESKYLNYPKYIVILKDKGYRDFDVKDIFYYVVATFEDSYFYYNDDSNFPIYLVIPFFYFYTFKGSGKFNLSKLGIDYIVNGLGLHVKRECTGSYPDNYVFVNEPDWTSENHQVDRRPLKRSYL